jgi:hypothetical protein
MLNGTKQQGRTKILIGGEAVPIICLSTADAMVWSDGRHDNIELIASATLRHPQHLAMPL